MEYTNHFFLNLEVGVIEYFHSKPVSLNSFLYLLSTYSSLPAVAMYNNETGFLKHKQCYTHNRMITYRCRGHPLLRQNKGVLLNMLKKNTHSLDSFLYILSTYPFLLPILMYNFVYFDHGVFRTYSIIHPYFAYFVQGSSH